MMKSLFNKYGGIVIGGLLATAVSLGVAHAQQQVPGATPVQSFQPLYACDQTFTATGAGNTTVTATSGAQNGKYFYVCHIDITEVANAAVTGAAGPQPTCTTSNLANNLTWWGDNGALTIGQMKPVIALVFGVVPLKTLQPGTAFTVACSGGQSTQSVRVNLSGFFNF
jgi:hypothetical protein